MSITLDGNSYATNRNQYTHSVGKIATTRRTLTGALDRIESGVIAHAYKITLLCTTAQIATLRTSLAKTSVVGTPPANLLNFIDEEGFNWNPASGVDDATHAYSTGVYFIAMSEPTPLSAAGWNTRNRFAVQIDLAVNAKNLAAA